MKRGLALLFAAAVLALAFVIARSIDANRARTVRQEAARVAEANGMRATDALMTHVRELKLEAQNAAANPRLVAALRGNADAATLQDLFRTEEWWEPYRNAFKVYAVAFEGDKLDVIEGMKNAEFASDLIVREAREGREAVAQIVMGKGWPFAAAASAVALPDKPIAPVLLLAKPIDDAAVRKLAEKARGAVLLSDGTRAVIEAGSEAETDLLKTAIGAETRGPIYQSDDGAWAAAVSSVVPGLWLWTFGGGAAAAHDAESTAVATTATVWSVAGVLALVGLFFGLRRGPPEPSHTGTLLPIAEVAPTGSSSPAFRTRQGIGDPKGQLPGSVGRAPAPFGSSETEVFSPPPPTARLNGGSSFGRYLLLDLLGEGGMAQVYTAVTFGAEGFRRTFVVKRLRAELCREPEVVAQFIDEAKLGSTLVHSNVIPVFDFGKVGDEYYLAQEYILGRDLGRMTLRALERSGHPLSATCVLHVAAQTLLALEYAHSKLGDGGRPLAIVHRDVSPSNILVSARGEVKLFDFGIVKAEGRVTKTQHGVVKGNVSFMSPEQARGANVDGRADLFSLGLVMFYCLTGSVLYHGETTYELLVKAATGPGPDELARIAALPAPCGPIVAKALEVDPNQRFQTAAEFAAALAPHTAGGAAAAAAMIAGLFGDDFRAEEARFAATVPDGQGRGDVQSRRT
ncbi:MAG TPA: serine/threonine-protein kinase [Polyangia bacterium]|nr:serine/threonine-protein kinase [Polyangia bacterium]